MEDYIYTKGEKEGKAMEAREAKDKTRQVRFHVSSTNYRWRVYVAKGPSSPGKGLVVCY
jgi:hypothetical protein